MAYQIVTGTTGTGQKVILDTSQTSKIVQASDAGTEKVLVDATNQAKVVQIQTTGLSETLLNDIQKMTQANWNVDSNTGNVTVSNLTLEGEEF